MAQEELSMLVCSDLHGDFGKFQAFVDLANKLATDVIVLNGDQIDPIMKNGSYGFVDFVIEKGFEDVPREEIQQFLAASQQGLEELVAQMGMNELEEYLSKATDNPFLQQYKNLFEAYKKHKGRKSLINAYGAIQRSIVRQYQDLNKLLSRYEGKVLVVDGNHDTSDQRKQLTGKNIINLCVQDAPVSIKGYSVAGSANTREQVPLLPKEWFPHVGEDHIQAEFEQAVEKYVKQGASREKVVASLLAQHPEYKRLSQMDKIDIMFMHKGHSALVPEKVREAKDYGPSAEKVISDKKIKLKFAGHFHDYFIDAEHGNFRTDPNNFFHVKYDKGQSRVKFDRYQLFYN